MLCGTAAMRCASFQVRRYAGRGCCSWVSVARTGRNIEIPFAAKNVAQRDIFLRSMHATVRSFATTASPNDCGGNRFAPACIEPQLVATTADIDDLPNHPEKLLIDVREPSELAATGQIPTSINIPLKTVRTELSLTPEAFEQKYGRKKPAASDPIIFSCRSGVRAGQAALEADQLGFKNFSAERSFFNTGVTFSRLLLCCSNTMSIATYEEVLDLPNHPEKLLVDVRNPDELAETGKIPTSINIPLDKVKQAFGPETSEEAFVQQYGVAKPGLDHYLILSCRTGRRSQMAIEAIAELGYRNARNYKGSWTEWAAKQGK
ncbi:thiosulfate sulfurtransferase-like isoform X1 [Anopheles stephensi]|uniref:thiosulfate sulfurtransferase-like isoform X1 n=1 Tax=Anopheles stephensi TaxID=30069 RepID=UPI0016587D1D|nr:thiosulfate sulfurtransferase-like isoform X1 [Anopheles stephensi]XP_035912138.1 thiosulfate sulfurtransferase-like isoform X1 [Anopheles stephensi]